MKSNKHTAIKSNMDEHGIDRDDYIDDLDELIYSNYGYAGNEDNTNEGACNS